MLRFAYQAEPLRGSPSPSLPAGSTVHWRPLLPVAIFGPTGLVRRFSRALLDPGADDTIFPLDTVVRLHVQLLADTGHRVRWRGQAHPLRFGPLELELTDGQATWRWSALVGFHRHRWPTQYSVSTAACSSWMLASLVPTAPWKSRPTSRTLELSREVLFQGRAPATVLSPRPLAWADRMAPSGP